MTNNARFDRRSAFQQPDNQLLCGLCLRDGEGNEIMHHAFKDIKLVLDAKAVQLLVKFEDVGAEHVVYIYYILSRKTCQ